jgi:hypothetical protein
MIGRIRVVAGLMLVPLSLAAQGPIAFGVSVARPEGGPTMPRLRLDLDKVSDTTTTMWMRTFRLKGALDLVSRADRNTEDSYLEADFGYRTRLGKAPPLNINDPDAIDTWPVPMLGFYADGRFESNQSFSEQLFSGQARVVFTHVGWTGLILLVPQVELAFGATRSVTSDVRDSLGIPSGTNTRFDLDAEWRVAFGRFATGVFDKLWLFVYVRAFSTSGLEPELESLGYSSGTWYAARLMYEVNVLTARGVFVQFARGALPTQPVSLGNWQVGLRR